MGEKWKPMRGFEGLYWVGNKYHIRNAKGYVKKPIRIVGKNGEICLVYKLHTPGQIHTVNMPQATRAQFSSTERAEWVNPLIVPETDTICQICKSDEVYLKKVNKINYLVCQNCGERFETFRVEGI
jgi:hypothetical protein